MPLPDLLITGISKYDISCHGCVFSHTGRQPFKFLGRDVDLDIQFAGLVDASKVLTDIDMLPDLDAFVQNPAVIGGLDAGALKVQFRLFEHDVSHIPRCNELLFLRADKCPLIFKCLKALQTRQIGLFNFIQLGLGDDFPVN